MNNAMLRVYLELLAAAHLIAEEELEVMETYITEENFENYFLDYVALTSHISSLRREIKQTQKSLGMNRIKHSSKYTE